MEPHDDRRHEGEREDEHARARRLRAEHHGRWVELEIQRAIRRGDFDDLPGAGKPLPDRGDEHDPEWWLKRLVEREQLNLLPPALALRTEDARLEQTLDALGSERQVREHLESFNARVVEARRQLQGGPPVVTSTRDVEHEIAQWRERRLARLSSRRREDAAPERERRRRWRWRR